MRTAQQQLCVHARPQTPSTGLHPTEHTDAHQWGFTRAPRFGKILSREARRVQQHLLYSELSRNRMNSHPNAAQGRRKGRPNVPKLQEQRALVHVGCWTVSFLKLPHPKLDFRPGFYDDCPSLLEQPQVILMSCLCHKNAIKP